MTLARSLVVRDRTLSSAPWELFGRPQIRTGALKTHRTAPALARPPRDARRRLELVSILYGDNALARALWSSAVGLFRRPGSYLDTGGYFNRWQMIFTT